MQAVTELKKFESGLDYRADRERLKKFVLFYNENGVFKYLDRLRGLVDSYEVELDDVAVYDESGLATRMGSNAWSYVELLSGVLDELQYGEEGGECGTDEFYHQRLLRFKERYPDRNPLEVFPAYLLRNYTVRLLPLSSDRAMALRGVGAAEIGALVTVRGIVTRVSMAKPAMRVAAYVCEGCGSETYQQVRTDAFDLLEECGSEKCRARNVRGTLSLLTRGSRFLKHQSVVVQELASEVPHGSVPRSMKVEVHAVLTGCLVPGQLAEISGIFMPLPYHGFKRLKAGLLNDTYLLGMNIKDVNRGEDKCIDVKKDEITSEHANPINSLLSTLLQLDSTPIDFPVLEILVDSFAPEIFGMRDVKRILVLMLAGAPALTKPDGMQIRGDINCLILGDPGIAKSQLLKTIARISPRGVFTTGRGSSGVGLTAAVAKDAVTGEVVLEGGALVLSDRGICCIDELDKMGENDRVAIHEVMEQQRVSISKAGINTTLNARCAILAAANPVSGRYNPKKSVEQNVGLPVSLISRFDVLCILNDDAATDSDLAMAEHISALHTGAELGAALPSRLSYAQLRSVFEAAKRIDPVLAQTEREAFVASYLRARAQNPSTTPRALLALIRLALAHARIHGRAVASAVDVEAARSLLEAMRVPLPKNTTALSANQAIYNLVLSLAVDNTVSLADLFLRADYPREQVEKVITDFEDTGVWIRNNESIIILN